jgi:hypothetical protein
VDVSADGPVLTRPKEIVGDEFEGFSHSIVTTNGRVMRGG